MTEESFAAVMVLEGNGVISYEKSEISFEKGECIFIPKRNARMKIKGKCKFLNVRI